MWKTASSLIAIVLVLLCLGIVMLASTSSVQGASTFDDPHYFLKRQFMWLGFSVVAALFAAVVDYHWWQRLAVPLSLLAVLLLVAVLVPGIGTRIGGSRRWLRSGQFSIQPSELGKFATVLMLAAWMTFVQGRAGKFREGLLYPCLGVGLMAGLILLEPDFGTALLTGAVGLLLMYVGGTRPGYLLCTGLIGVCGFALAIMHDRERMGRILAFLWPDRYPDEAYQLFQSRDAFIMAGPWGVGLGESLQKHFYLPEAHTDFILAIIGEELGLPATGLVVLLFVGLLICGVVISLHAPDAFGRLLGFGITAMISLQAVINMGVVTGCLPTKGLALPFISYGGSSLVASLAGVGVLVNIARHSMHGFADVHTEPVKDRMRRV